MLALVDSSGTILGGLPVVEGRNLSGRRRWVALPYADRCHPLLSSPEDEVALVRLLDRARGEARIAGLEVRAALAGARRKATVGVLHTLPLDPDPASVYARLSRSQTQRNIRRAEREEIVVRRATEEAELVDTYYRFHLATHRQHGAPTQPKRFFRLIWRHLVEPGHGFLLLSEHRGTPVAGAVFLLAGSTVVYKYGGSDPAHRQVRANFPLFWEAIRWGCLAGYRTFDFGRTDFGNEGLRRFKSAWGAAEHPLTYSLLADGAGEDWPGTMGGRSTGVLKRSPAWVGRIAGAMLYRYAIDARTSAK